MEEWQTIRRLFGVKMVEFWGLILDTGLPTLKISEWDSRNCPTKIGPFEWEMLEIFAPFSPVSYMLSLSQKLPHLQSHAIAPLWGWQACIYNHLHSQWFAQGNMSSHMQGIYTTLRIGEEGSEAGIYIQQQYNLENTILFISSSHARIHVTKQGSPRNFFQKKKIDCFRQYV